jgi:hypothetical protein
MRPEWLLIPERSYDCADRYYCFQAAQHAILNMGTQNGTAMYEQEKIFYSEITESSPRKVGPDFHLGRRFLYKLDKE